RERMDFIAAVSTLDPTWVVPLDILSEIIDPVWGGEGDEGDSCPRLFLLLDNIARSEGIRAGGLELNLMIVDTRGDQENEEFRYGFSTGDLTKHNSNRPKYERRSVKGNQSVGPHKLAIYLGTAGLQALY